MLVKSWYLMYVVICVLYYKIHLFVILIRIDFLIILISYSPCQINDSEQKCHQLENYFLNECIYHFYTHLPSSPCRVASTDIPDPLSPLLRIIHRFWQVKTCQKRWMIYPVSSHSCCMYVRAGRPAFAWPYAGVHRSTSLMSSSLLLQRCPVCLLRLNLIVFVMGGRWPYSWCLVGCWTASIYYDQVTTSLSTT